VRRSPNVVIVATDDAEVEADAAGIAIPTAPLAEIEFDPPLEGPNADALRTVTYGQNSKLFLRLRSSSPPSAIMCRPRRTEIWLRRGSTPCVPERDRL
jgi:Flavin containing amine oxidoreductase